MLATAELAPTARASSATAAGTINLAERRFALVS
jgi:hypothetical protein